MTGKATPRNLFWIFLLTTLALLVANLPASAEISQRDQKAIADAGTCESPQSALQSCGLIYIATVRKNHTQSTAAPVWFTTGTDNQLVSHSDRQGYLESEAHKTREPGPGLDR
jgi:hypothetical protein